MYKAKYSNFKNDIDGFFSKLMIDDNKKKIISEKIKNIWIYLLTTQTPK